jgi:IS5 family transposase
MDARRVPPPSAAAEIGQLLDSAEIADLIAGLDELQWTGRPGYPKRSLVGACLVKAIYAIPTWTRTVALIREHGALRNALGDSPSVYALYRFTAKLRAHGDLLDACIARVLASLRDELPEMGRDLAIDGSDLPAYANGQRFVSKGGRERQRFSDPDASWGHRSAISTRKGGGYYGYKLHAAVCTRTGLPLAWEVRTAREAEVNFAVPLLDAVVERGFVPGTVACDKGYDAGAIHAAFELRDCRPVIPLRKAPPKATNPAGAPTCEHGTWTFAGADYGRKTTKWRCPTGDCCPASVWIKADRRHPLIPRETKRWRDLYRGRAAVEREFGYLKHHHGLATLRVRGLDRVALHANLTILARLARALVRTRVQSLAA